MLLLNNTLLPSASLALPNRGLVFGDGFFETLVVAHGRLRYALHHHARMQQAARALYLTLPEALASVDALENTLVQLAQANNLAEARLRVQLWRSGGGRYTPLTDSVEWLATAEAFVANDSVLSAVGYARETHAQASPLSFCKGPQAWLYVRAAHERRQRGLDEIILCSAAGHIAEAGAAAVFWLKEGTLYTPALETGCVAGVRRAHLLRVARQHQVACVEGLFTHHDLAQAETVFLANVASIRVVGSVEQRQFQVQHAQLSALRTWEQET